MQLPMCSAYPGPLSVLVMDNAKIHHGVEILELVDRFGRFSIILIGSKHHLPVPRRTD
jgi:hypothetical protein